MDVPEQPNNISATTIIFYSMPNSVPENSKKLLEQKASFYEVPAKFSSFETESFRAFHKKQIVVSIKKAYSVISTRGFQVQVN